jgi:hypothetical protein
MMKIFAQFATSLHSPVSAKRSPGARNAFAPPRFPRNDNVAGATDADKHIHHATPKCEGSTDVKTGWQGAVITGGTSAEERNKACDAARPTDIGQPANWIAADIVRLEDGLLAEHWDVIQDEATREESISGLPMFGAAFPPRD